MAIDGSVFEGKSILFAAGGTGGHINPALAVAKRIRDASPTARIAFAGTSEKMEAKLVPAAGFELLTFEISGFQRKPSVENIKRNIKALSQLALSSGRIKRILLDFRPDAAIGFGGYVSGPVIRMAHRMGIPCAIHEQNAYPGVANKALAKYADAVMLTSPEAEKYLKTKNPCVITGLPVRENIITADRDESRQALGIDARPMVLSMGGSLGARAINEAASGMIALLHGSERCYFLHATGQYGLWVPDKLRELGVDPDAEAMVTVREYIDNMEVCLAAADIVISRAGASSLSEIQAAGKAAILIPSPNVAENHQLHNAMSMAQRGAAIVIEEKDLTAQRLADEVSRLLDHPEERERLAGNAKGMAVLDSAERMIRVIASLVQRQGGQTASPGGSHG